MIQQILLYIAIPIALSAICLLTPVEKWIPNVSRKTSNRIVAGAILGFILTTSFMAILRLYSLSAKGMDMGVWEHHIYTMLMGTASLSQYLHRPIFILYIPLYAVGQIPSLLILQSILVGLGGWVFYRFCLTVLENPGQSLLLSVAYLLYFPNWYLCLYDFHSDHWFPLLLGLMYLIEFKIVKNTDCTQRSFKQKKTYILILLLTLMLFISKEIMPFVLSVYFITAYCRTNKKTYLYLFYFTSVAICFAFFIVTQGYEFQKIDSLLPKFFFFLCLLMPFGFFSLGSLSWILPAIIPFLYVMSSPSPVYYSIGTQYPAIFLVPFVYSSILTLRNIQNRRSILSSIIPADYSLKLCAMILILNLFFHTLLAPTPLSRQFWLTSMHSEYHWSKFIPTERDLQIIQLLKKEFPPGLYSVSVQNDLYFPPLGRQKHWTIFPYGIEECDRVVFDKSTGSEYGDFADHEHFQTALRIFKEKFELIHEMDGLEIWERV